MKKIAAVIPARYDSSRFKGKPLALIHGKPMIQWVYERVLKCSFLSCVYVATDDKRIYDAVTSFGGKAVMTAKEHESGTDRIAEAVSKIEEDIDIVLNIQGDEPMIRVDMIKDLASAFEDEKVYMATLKKEISGDDITNPNIAKLITDRDGYAIYFSRLPIPYDRDNSYGIKYFKHIGVYGYTKEFLYNFSKLPQSSLEAAEKLEQLRVIENGYRIKVIETKHQSIGVDLPEHIGVVEREMEKEGIV